MTALLGDDVSAYKANAPVAGQSNPPTGPSAGVRAPIYAANTRISPARFPVAEAPQCGVEGEVAFRFRYGLPPRVAPYTRDEVAAAVDACVAIEVVSSRFANPDAATFYEKLADGASSTSAGSRSSSPSTAKRCSSRSAVIRSVIHSPSQWHSSR
jgi:2-keto-4-pentenoate hydratase